MKLALFGATGATGRHLVEQALAAGHTLTVLARDPARVVPPSHPAVTVVRGDAANPGDVRKTVEGADAVLSTLGGTSLRDESTISGAATLIVDAMKSAGVRRLVVMGSAGIFGEVPGIPGLIVRVLLRHPLRDHRRQYEILAASDLEWTLVRAVRLTDGPRTGDYRVAREGCPPGSGALGRADVADYMLRCLGDAGTVRSCPSPAY